MTNPSTRRRNTIAQKKSTSANVSPSRTIIEARKRAQLYPMQPQGWRMLGMLLMSEQPIQALEALTRALALAPDDYVTLESLAELQSKLGNEKAAIEHIERALAINPNSSTIHFRLATLLYRQLQYEKALTHIELADKLSPGNNEILSCKGNILYRLFRFDGALEVFEKLTQQNPQHYGFWNNVGNVKRDTGKFQEADKYYERSIALAKNDAVPFSNRLTTLHYRPDIDREFIYDVCKQWQARFAPKGHVVRPIPVDLRADRTLRIGIFSDGFRAHPVGWMSTAALENLKKNEIELYSYSTNQAVDHLTQRIQRISTKWTSIQHLSDDAFAELIRGDQIDILIDLCGHNAGNRMQVMVMEPVPILVKWVGGLINTTGVEAIDYLITDPIETPAGEEAFYTEKLIRMPDDYICFSPPHYSPPVGSLPALQNGYVTLGCFNNPIKINNVLLTEWSLLMQSLSDSRLLLKGHQFASEKLCTQIREHMFGQGIAAERIIFEGQSKHQALLETYNRIDIALDPWPYSGGLTTCEAMLMGVPVVTLPGPTFAGRHSATHLVNAGMPELVVNNWDEYRDRVVELASDLNSLSTIRMHLRDILLQSPVCDGPRFAGHFSIAMRAIWQRYCEGKSPAGLDIDKQGNAKFETESEPIKIIQPAPLESKRDAEFSFAFNGKIVVVDNGGVLFESSGFRALHKLGVFSTIVFDPSSRIVDIDALTQGRDAYHFPHTVLSDGQPAALRVCINPALNTTLTPLPVPARVKKPLSEQTIAELSINTHRLDDIEGLDYIDWLLFDDLNDSLKAIENGKNKITSALLIQARISFAPTHERQPELTQISELLSLQGFRLYRLNNLKHETQFPVRTDLIKNQATKLAQAEAIYIPTAERLTGLTDNQRRKLAFLLHTVYGVHDLTFELLQSCDPKLAEIYLCASGYIQPSATIPATTSVLDIRGTIGKGWNAPPAIPNAPHMSVKERRLFEKYLKPATRYYEFGSGGSTKMAIENGKTVYGVESDKNWVQRLKDETGPLCEVEYVDIGPTKEWGYPVKMTNREKFTDYSGAIQKHSKHFDLVLVDGRFRVACVINALMHTLRTNATPRSTHIFIHDFWDRPHYHAVLTVLDIVERADTAGVFRIRDNITQETLAQILAAHAYDPN